MKQLTILSPAEAYLVLEGRNASDKELLKFTFVDLLLKKVLQIFEIVKRPSRHEDLKKYIYVQPGENFFSHQPLKHERIFLSPFVKQPDMKILLHNLLKIAVQDSASKKYYHLMIAESPSIRLCFSTFFWYKLTGNVKHTQEGKKMKSTLEAELKQIKENYPETAFQELSEKIYGNTLLVSESVADIAGDADKFLAYALKRRNKTSGSCSGGVSCYSGCSGCGGGCGSSCGST